MRVESVLLVLVAAFGAAGCTEPPEASQAPGGTWLPSIGPERDAAIERQFRGFDMAMVETGYRFSELYWAGLDQNWAYATYQAEKIGTAIQNGLERRPARAASARPFLEAALPMLQGAIETRDPGAFAVSFEGLMAACNSCHAAERMEFVQVTVPTLRAVPVGG